MAENWLVESWLGNLTSDEHQSLITCTHAVWGKWHEHGPSTKWLGFGGGSVSVLTVQRCFSHWGQFENIPTVILPLFRRPVPVLLVFVLGFFYSNIHSNTCISSPTSDALIHFTVNLKSQDEFPLWIDTLMQHILFHYFCVTLVWKHGLYFSVAPVAVMCLHLKG